MFPDSATNRLKTLSCGIRRGGRPQTASAGPGPLLTAAEDCLRGPGSSWDRFDRFLIVMYIPWFETVGVVRGASNRVRMWTRNEPCGAPDGMRRRRET